MPHPHLWPMALPVCMWSFGTPTSTPRAKPDLQGGGSSSNEKPEGLGHQSSGGGQGREEEEARGLGRLACHPVHDAAVGNGADHLERGEQSYTNWARGCSGPIDPPQGCRVQVHPGHWKLAMPRGQCSPGRAHPPWSWPGNRLSGCTNSSGALAGIQTSPGGLWGSKEGVGSAPGQCTLQPPAHGWELHQAQKLRGEPSHGQVSSARGVLLRLFEEVKGRSEAAENAAVQTVSQQNK